MATSADAVDAYQAGLPRVLEAAPRECCCGGRLKGHGQRMRWVVCWNGIRRVRVQRMICMLCGKTSSLLPRFLYPFYQCARDLAERIAALWQSGRHAMSDVQYLLSAEAPRLMVALSSLYRWARIPA